MSAAAQPDFSDYEPLPSALIASAMDAAFDGIVIANAEGRFLYVNQAHARQHGYADPGELRGISWTMLYELGEAERIFAEAIPALERGGVWQGAATGRRRDGSTFPQEITMTWLAEGGVICASRDVSERTAFAAEARRLSEMRARAEAASTAKSDLLAQVSHEIRTPLNAVMGLASVLARGALSSQQREIVALIESSSATMERLLSDLLDVSKIEAGKMLLHAAPFDLGATVEAATRVARVHAEEKGVSCQAECAPGARGMFVGDEFRVRQLVLNLVSNAVKFTAQGQVSIVVDAHDHGGGCEVEIAVRDTGIGFRAEDAERLFQRFEQGDSGIAAAHGGTGLGLSICKSLTEAMGGRIEVRSAPGAGSTFTLRLPLTRAVASVAQRDAIVEPTEAALRILVAEDHPTNRKVVALILESVGADVMFVHNGADAIAARRAHDFHLILMDMLMPVMGGLDAVRNIRAFEAATGASRTPIAILSAHAREDQRVQALNAGADHYITKPLTAAILLEGIERAIELGLRKG